LHLRLDHIGGFDGVARLEGALDDAARLQVANPHAIERLAFAGLHHLVFENGIRIIVENDLNARPEFVRTEASHFGTVALSDRIAGLPVAVTVWTEKGRT
jgi:hypothetical protein